MMRTAIKYLLCLSVILSYAGMALGGQLVVLRSMISSGAESAIASEAGKSAPPETRVLWTQGKFTIPAANPDLAPAPKAERAPFFIPKPETIPHHIVIYTILVSHFPYPPFWPRDPSLAAVLS